MRYEEHLRNRARERPGHVALVCGDRRMPYGELADAAERFAAALVSDCGFANGDRCVLFLENRPETAIGLFGTLRAGGIFSIINPTTKADKLAYVLNNCEAAVLVTQASLLPAARAAEIVAPTGLQPARLPGGREMPLSLSREIAREYELGAADVDAAAAEEMLEERLRRDQQASLLSCLQISDKMQILVENDRAVGVRLARNASPSPSPR